MPYFTNPFKKHDVSEFEGVLVPLQQAAHRNSVATQRRTSITSQISRKSEKASEKADSNYDSSVTVGLTIESLKAEIEADLAAGESHTSYDRRLCDYFYDAHMHLPAITIHKRC